MKKLALAPAVAIAITGLAASPVIAAPEAPASATQQPAAPSALKAQAGSTSTTETISQADFGNAEKGVDIVGAGLQSDHDYEITVAPTGGQKVEELTTTATTNADGGFSHKVYGVDDSAFVGTYSVVVNDSADSNTSFQMSFTVTAGDSDEPEAPETDPKVSLNADKFTESEFAENGVRSPVKDSLRMPQSTS